MMSLSSSFSLSSSVLPFDQSWSIPPGFQVYYSPCSTKTINEIPPLLYCIHGVNHSGLSFQLLSNYVKEIGSLLTYDLRGHGQSTIPLGGDLSLNTLVNDSFTVLDTFLLTNYLSVPSTTTSSTNTISNTSTEPKSTSPIIPKIPIILIGHSLGASIVTQLSSLWSNHYSSLSSSSSPLSSLNISLAGLMMIDFTEGGALSSLEYMKNITDKLALQKFPTVQTAIDWILHSQMLKLRTSAELSIPSCLQYIPNTHHQQSVNEMNNNNNDDENPSTQHISLSMNNQDSTSTPISSLSSSSIDNTIPISYYQWRASEFLQQSSSYWFDWFTGSTERFLSSSCPRLLFISSMDKLSQDSGLMAGQVSGKYQLSIIAGVGHVMQEDAPDKLGIVIRAFLSRNHLCTEIEHNLLQMKLHTIQQQKQLLSPNHGSPSSSPQKSKSSFSP